MIDFEFINLISKTIGTILFLIIIVITTQIYWKLIIPNKEIMYTNLNTIKDKIDIVIPTVYPKLAIKNMRRIYKLNNVNKIFIITPKTGVIKNDYLNKFIIIKDYSDGRAEAINKSLKFIESKYLLLLDEDLEVTVSTILKGISLLKIYDIIKLNLIPKFKCKTLLSKMIHIERDYTELIQQPKSTPLFGGTGFFKTSVLKDLKFNNKFLTEDVELTVRAHLKNYKITVVNSLFAKEEYPNFKSWLIQRRRWAYGWYQVFIKHRKDIFKNSNVLKLIGTQPFVFLPFLIILGVIFGNFFPSYINISMSFYCLSPFLYLGYNKYKLKGLIYPFYILFLIFYSTLSCIFPPKKYYITPKA